jgi:hypothetical protein
MASRPPHSKPERPVHTLDQKRRDIDRLLRRIKELEEFDPQSVDRRFRHPKVQQMETAIDETLASVFGHGTVEYDRYKWANQLDHGPVVLDVESSWIAARGGGAAGGRRNEVLEARQYLSEGKEQALALLRQAVRGLEEEIELVEASAMSHDEKEHAARRLSRVRTQKRSTKRHPATIYYALAVLSFLRDTTQHCLLDDIIRAFQITAEGDIVASNLLRNESILEQAVYKLKEIEAVEVDVDEYASPILGRKKNLEELVNRFDAGDMPVVNRFLKAGARHRDWKVGALFNLQSKKQDAIAEDDSAPATNRGDEESYWEPLPLERHTQEAIEAIETTEAALREIEQNNGYASTEPDERNGIVESIKGTLRAIKGGFPSKNVIVAGLLAPLKFIAKKFSEASMGEAAKIAVAALIKWLF